MATPSQPQQGIPRHELDSKVKSILAELLEVDVNEIQDATRMEEDLGTDSLLFFELFEEFNDAFEVDLDLQEIGKYSSQHKMATVRDLVDLLDRFLREGESMFEGKESA